MGTHHQQAFPTTSKLISKVIPTSKLISKASPAVTLAVTLAVTRTYELSP